MSYNLGFVEYDFYAPPSSQLSSCFLSSLLLYSASILFTMSFPASFWRQYLHLLTYFVRVQQPLASFCLFAACYFVYCIYDRYFGS